MKTLTPWLLGGGAVVGLLLLSNASAAAPARPGSRPDPAPTPPPRPPPVPSSRLPASAVRLPLARELLATLKPGSEASWTAAQKLSAAHPGLQLSALLERLSARGFQPVVGNSWRSLSTQDILLAEGSTTVSFSFHNAVDEQGYPRALAADVIDRRYGFGDEDPASTRTRGAAGFFLALGQEAKALGLTWGGDWERRGLWAAFGLGWDPVHVQALPNNQLPTVRDFSLPRILGRGVLKPGTGGYTYRQWPNGYVQVASGPAAVGTLLLPRGNRTAWTAVTAEVGPYPAGGVA